MITMVAVGDLVETNLSWIGITSTRIEKVFGIKNCGCDQRQSALNAWGYRVQYRIIMFVGGPADMPWRERARVVQGRLCRIWKTTISKLPGTSGSGGTRP